jgi:hypothetical protein
MINWEQTVEESLKSLSQAWGRKTKERGKNIMTGNG